MSRMLGLAVVLVLLVAAPASAQSPTIDGYGGAGSVLGDVRSGSSPPSGSDASPEDTTGAAAGVAGVSDDGGSETAPVAGTAGVNANGGSTADAPFTTRPIATAGQLPFTGLDVGLLAAGSFLLIALGFGLRRYGGRSSVTLA